MLELKNFVIVSSIPIKYYTIAIPSKNNSSQIMNRPVKKAQLSPGLKSLSRENLENLLSDLYDRFENVRNFIDLRLSGNGEQLIKKYKKLIRKQLEEGLEEGTNGLQEALRVVQEFSAAGTSPRDQADVMLSFVESAVFCIGNYGDLYENFYDEAENMFYETLGFMKHHHLLDEFKQRCRKIVDESADTGYGFHESLGDLFGTFFSAGKSKMRLLIKKPVIVKAKKI